MKLGTGIFGLLTLAVTLGSDAMANSIRFDFTAAGGSTPLVRALFEDAGAAGVRLTLTAPGLSGNNSVQTLFFNLNPGLNPAELSVTPIGQNSGIASTSDAKKDWFKTGGGGKYDLTLNFSALPPFVSGDTLSFDINRAGGLTADDFDFLNTLSASRRQNFAAVKILMPIGFEIVPGEPVLTPGPTPVPDTASTAGLAGLGLGSLMLLRNWRQEPARIS